MMRPIMFLLIAMGILCPAIASAEGEQSLISGVDAFKPAGSSAAAMGLFSPVEVTGQKFATATRTQTKGSPANRWDVALATPVSTAIQQGDVLIARFWVRTHEAMADAGVVGIALELNREPYEKLAEGQYNAPREWTQIQVPMIAKKAFDAGTLSMNLRLGYADQTIDVGGVELVRLPAGTKLETLPRTPLAYRGIEDNAPWRREAMARIDRIRKANLTITVRDEQGKPLAGQPVHVRLTRHAFAFGTAVDGRLMLADTDAAAAYRRQVEANFNTVVYENDLKWLGLAADPGRYSVVDRTLPWFADRKIDVRGHVLVWPALKWLPPDVRALQNAPPAIRQAINEHVTELATRYRGRLTEWDVLNEPFSNRDLEKILGRECYVDFFKLARAADPKARLFINDFGILETGNRTNTEHQKHYEDTIRFLLDNGAPLDGIGIQGHFGSAVTDPEKMLEILDRFGKFGKPIRITELDVNLLDPDLRASFLRDVMIVCFSHPSVDGIVQWGFWEGRHWLPEAAPFDRNWNLRPHGQAWKSLMDQWTTDVTVVSGPTGVVTVRGFLGDYTIESGQTRLQAKLLANGDAGTTVEIKVR